MSELSKEAILAAEDRKPEKVPCPEWGGDCWIRPLDGTQRDRWDQISGPKIHGDDDEEPDYRGLRAVLVAMSLCDENGESLGFTDFEVQALSRKSAKPLNRLFKKAQKLSGIGDEAIEDAAKNSETDPSGDVGSSFRSSSEPPSTSCSEKSTPEPLPSTAP